MNEWKVWKQKKTTQRINEEEEEEEEEAEGKGGQVTNAIERKFIINGNL